MLTNKTLVLGISGGIAAYKAADLASKMTQAGAKVRVIMTQHALEFITPLTLEAITGYAVVSDMFETSAEHRINHIALSEVADVIVVAPATANIMAKVAGGLADDMLSTTLLATRKPVVFVPAMHSQMWENPATRENEAKLKARGFYVIPPGVGRLASGGMGAGRFPETEVIIGHINKVLGQGGDLAGRRIVVTAGGTQEALDPVRILSNRSSGKMGCAIAEAARDRGAEVTLILTPTVNQPRPAAVEVVNVESAQQMKVAVSRAVKKADALIMAAAVADYQAAKVAAQKIKKTAGKLSLDLINTPDILAEIKGSFVKIGFAAESQDLLKNARQKLEKKGLDLIVANDISGGGVFGADDNQVTLLSKEGKTENLPVLSKREVADRILDAVVGLLAQRKD